MKAKHLLMTLSRTFDADQLIDEVMSGYPEATCCITCVSYNYKKCQFEFWDHEVDQKTKNDSVIPATIQNLDLIRSGHVPFAVTYKLDRHALQAGMAVLRDQIQAGKLRGLAIDMDNFTDAGAWDCFCADALVQCAIFGDVIYG